MRIEVKRGATLNGGVNAVTLEASEELILNSRVSPLIPG
jgi:hypothetical protein